MSGDMTKVVVTVLRSGWWLPGRALIEGQAFLLDAATAQALARRGIVRIQDDRPAPDDVASNAITRLRRRKTEDKTA